MSKTLLLECSCGQTSLEVKGSPIASVECCCLSCREVAEQIQGLNGAPHILTEYGATPFVMYRKDRVRFVSGVDSLREIRLSPEAKTRRVVAICCNSAIFLEFPHGHWLSIYAGLWPNGSRLPLEMRTMAADVPDGITLPDDVPNAKKQSFRFFAELLGAWIAMGFRIPRMPEIKKLNI